MAMRWDLVVLADVVYDVPEACGSKAEIGSRFPNYLIAKTFPNLLFFVYRWGHGVIDEVINEGIGIVFLEAEEGIDEVVVANVLEFEVQIIASPSHAVHSFQVCF